MSQQVNETKQIAAFLLKEIDRLIDRERERDDS